MNNFGFSVTTSSGFRSNPPPDLNAIRVRVPGPRWRPGDPPHRLVISGVDAYDGKGWEVFHPETCGRACHWWPGAGDDIFRDRWWRVVEEDTARVPRIRNDGHWQCHVQYELDNNGLDSLSLDCDPPIELDDPTEVGEWNNGGTWLPRYAAEWTRLPAGSYAISGWYTPWGWAGSEPVDPDGGLHLIGLWSSAPMKVLCV